MNATMRRLLGRSVQLAVMATPSSTLSDAIAEARRRQSAAASWISGAMKAAAAPAPAPA